MSQIEFEKNIDELQQFDWILFHRPHLTKELATFLLSPHRKARICADFDDLIFDVKYVDQTPMVKVRGSPFSLISTYIARTAEALEFFDHMSVSTQPLAEHAGQLFPNISTCVVPNGLDPGYIALSKFVREKSRSSQRAYRFGYFSGTASHDADLQMIAPLLHEAMTQDTTIRLLLVGPVALPAMLQDFPNRIDQRELVPFHQLPSVQSEVEIVLAPLEDTVFTRCKSGLKFFEAVAAGCKVIATPIPDIDRFTSELLTKCTSEDEWRSALCSPRLINEGDIENEACRIMEETAISRQIDVWLREREII